MSRHLKRCVFAALLLGLSWAGQASACELDGMSHGYGPMSALFAGAHRYQSLNGLEDEPPAEPAAAPESASTEDAEADVTASQGVPAVHGAASANTGTDTAADTTSPTPRRSFASWVRTAPKPTESSDAPAAWMVAETGLAAPTPAGD